MNIAEIDLGEAGTQYANRRVGGGGAISSALLRCAGPLTKAFAPLPAGTSFARAVQFEQGGITDEAATLEWLATKLGREYAGRPDLSVWFEDSYADPNDLVRYPPPRPALVAGQTVIYAVQGIDAGGMEEAISAATSFDYIGFVGFFVLPELSGALNYVGDGLIKSLARQVELVLVSAYDREGVVVSA